jgi:hypothetical protein
MTLSASSGQLRHAPTLHWNYRSIKDLVYAGNELRIMLKEGEARTNERLTDVQVPRAQREVTRDKRALRVLLDTFHLQPETRLDDRLGDPSVRREIGKLISRHFKQTYW